MALSKRLPAPQKLPRDAADALRAKIQRAFWNSALPSQITTPPSGHIAQAATGSLASLGDWTAHPTHIKALLRRTIALHTQKRKTQTAFCAFLFDFAPPNHIPANWRPAG